MPRMHTYAHEDDLPADEVNDFIVNHAPTGETEFDTDWETLTLQPGFTASASLQVRRIGMTVYARGVVVAGTAVANSAYLANIPAGPLRPERPAQKIIPGRTADTNGCSASLTIGEGLGVGVVRGGDPAVKTFYIDTSWVAGS